VQSSSKSSKHNTGTVKHGSAAHAKATMQQLVRSSGQHAFPCAVQV